MRSSWCEIYMHFMTNIFFITLWETPSCYLKTPVSQKTNTLFPLSSVIYKRLWIPVASGGREVSLLSDEAMYLISPYPHIYIQFPRTKVAGEPAIAVPRSLTDPPPSSAGRGMVQLRPAGAGWIFLWIAKQTYCISLIWKIENTRYVFR